jgi:hypothetical protein
MRPRSGGALAAVGALALLVGCDPALLNGPPGGDDNGGGTLATPTGFAVSGVPGSSTVSFTWTASTGAESYNLSYGTTNNASAAVDSQSFSGTSGTVNGLTSGTTYYFFLAAAASGKSDSAKTASVSATTAMYVAVNDITSNTTWSGVVHVTANNALNYYGDRKIRIYPGVTLTILPGTVVRLDAQVELIAEGTLSAVGTSLQGIVFQSYATPDYSPGGVAVAYTWAWSDISSYSGGVVNIAYATIQDTGYLAHAAVTSGSGQVNVDQSTIGPTLWGGVDIQNGDSSSSVTNSYFHLNDSYYGNAYSGTASIYDISLGTGGATESGNTGDDGGFPYYAP